MNTPYYLIDEAALRRNLEILRGVRERTGCKILLAQKAFSMFAVYPIIAEYLDGATASGLFEARLAAEELQGENHVFSAAYRAEDIPELARLCDHVVFNSCAQLRAYAQRSDFEKLCAEAREYGFAMVAINPAPVSLCKDLLAGTSVHVGAAVGFPLGQSTPKVKKYETVDAIANGADEIDYVINITQLKEKNYDFIEHEMAGIVEECRSAGVISKVIFENCYLTEEGRGKRRFCRV